MKSYLQKLKYSIGGFNADVLNYLAIVIPVLIVLSMAISWIVAFAIFITSEGYSSQIEMMKLNGFSFDAIGAAFTSGTVGILYGKVVTLIIGVLLLAQIGLFVRSFFNESTKTQRIVMVVDLSIVGLSIVGAILLDLYTNVIASAMNGSGGQGIRMSLLTISVLTIAAAISLLIFIVKSKDKWILGYVSLSAILAWTAFPLLLLLVENIVPLIAGIFFLLLFCAVIWFICASVADGGSSSAPTSTGRKNEPKKKNPEPETKTCEYVDRGFLGFKIFRVHGVMHDYVERDNGVGTGRICYLKNLRNGSFHIYDQATGKPITENEIPWRK